MAREKWVGQAYIVVKTKRGWWATTARNPECPIRGFSAASSDAAIKNYQARWRDYVRFRDAHPAEIGAAYT